MTNAEDIIILTFLWISKIWKSSYEYYYKKRFSVDIVFWILQSIKGYLSH